MVLNTGFEWNENYLLYADTGSVPHLAEKEMVRFSNQ